jgi:hypothetical protein
VLIAAEIFSRVAMRICAPAALPWGARMLEVIHLTNNAKG